MQILTINGSPHSQGCTDFVLTVFEKQLANHGISSKRLWVGTSPLSGCLACGGCVKTGQCVLHDAVNEAAELCKVCEGLVVASPVYYGAPTGQLISFLDRLFHSAGTHLAHKPGCCMVNCRRGGASSAFDVLNKYFLFNNMPVMPSVYWNQTHGTSPDKVAHDLEGLQTVRLLADNMAFAVKSLALAKENGLEEPAVREKIRTDYIP